MSKTSQQRVVVLGASDRPDRYSHRAMRELLAAGHDVVPVNPALLEILGRPVVPRLEGLTPPVDTVTVYVSPSISTLLAGAFLALRPGRVIFNPGSENPGLEETLAAAGIACERSCTLVLLRSAQF